MSEKPCPFIIVDVETETKWLQGCANWIHPESNSCLAMVAKHFVPEMKELIDACNQEVLTKPCPFSATDIISKGCEGWINFCHVETMIPIAMVKEDLSGEVKELIKIWEEKYDRI
jgi:hypothetical protein